MIEVLITIFICATVLVVTYVTRELILKYYSIYAPAKVDITEDIRKEIDLMKSKLTALELQRGIGNVTRRQ